MRAINLVRPIAKQSATSATREAHRGQTALRLFGFFRPEQPSPISHTNYCIFTLTPFTTPFIS